MQQELNINIYMLKQKYIIIQKKHIIHGLYKQK